MIVVDSSVWIDQMRGRTTTKTAVLAQHVTARVSLALTDVVYMEVLRGAQTRAELARVKLSVDQTRILRMRNLADFESAAELYRLARRRGHTVRRATDCMIAAVCIRDDVPLLHDDADFDKIAAVSTLRVV